MVWGFLKLAGLLTEISFRKSLGATLPAIGNTPLYLLFYSAQSEKQLIKIFFVFIPGNFRLQPYTAGSK